MGLKEQVVAALAVAYEDIEINGVTIRANALSGDEQLRLSDLAEDMAPSQVVFWMLERALTDPGSGERLFDDGDPALRALDGGHLTALLKVVQRLSGMEEKAKN